MQKEKPIMRSDKLDSKSHLDQTEAKAKFTLRIISFGYKLGTAPVSNALFDVRFLKNPFWVEELRPLSGKDKAVQDYVIGQKAGRDFLDSIVELLSRLLPQLEENDLSEFSIAFGCTGGQHRSATMVELLAREMEQKVPGLKIEKIHRELDGGKQPQATIAGEEN